MAGLGADLDGSAGVPDSHVPVPEPTGKTRARAIAETVLDGVTGNAVAAHRFAEQNVAGGLSLKDTVISMRERANTAGKLDDQALEGMLRAQAATLDVIFTELAKRAALHLDQPRHDLEAYLRMAMRAQDQARKTAETLAAIRNPGAVVIAKAANINNGQQVNIGTLNPATLAHDEQHRHPRPPRAERLDAGTEGASGRPDSHLETVGTIDRAAHP